VRPRALLDEPLLTRFLTQVSRRLGLDFGPHRLDAFSAGVTSATAHLGLASPHELLARLERDDGTAMIALGDALTIGETYFFRDAQHFRLLRTLLEQTEHPMTLWSAGCAGGAEPYTMAIMALDLFGDRAAERVSILATDLSERALTQAREGCFRPWAFRGVDDEVKRRWFEPEGNRLRAIAPVRELVRFRRLNLVDLDAPDWPHSVDVAFCRNVLVYFDGPAIERAATGLRRALGGDGWLICGPSDPLITAYGLAVDASGGFIAYRPAGERPPDAAAPPAAPETLLPALAAAGSTTPELPLPGPATGEHERPGSTVPERQPPASPAGAGPSRAAAPAGAADELETARDLADRGHTEAAIDLLDRRARDRPLDTGPYLLRAALRQAGGDHAGAVSDCRRALLLDRTLAYAHLVAAPSLLMLGDRAGARRALRNARALLTELAPDTPVVTPSEATAAELLAACVQLERNLSPQVHGG
jgi:chemotaxis protein methyltransferase CheR